MNQQGEVQAIGGLNEKIEGFFDVCKIKGLSGKQGVIMPHTNVEDLMLREEILDAVSPPKKFHIWPVARIEEGIEILTRRRSRANAIDDGTFEKGTVFALIDDA